MKTAHEIFLTVGVPLYRLGSPVARPGFRGFNEHDIAEIQRDALKAAAFCIVADGNPMAAKEKILQAIELLEKGKVQ